MREVLVLGYGNTLRGDDAVGPLVAEEVARWGRPGVTSLALPQLFPELAEQLSHVARAIFVDAAISGDNCVEAAEPLSCGPTLHHTGDPPWLLALTQAVFGRCPPAWFVRVSVDHLGYGEGLSERGRAGLSFALEQIRRLLDEA
jgi:hydrogenase maturation protease